MSYHVENPSRGEKPLDGDKRKFRNGIVIQLAPMNSTRPLENLIYGQIYCLMPDTVSNRVEAWETILEGLNRVDFDPDLDLIVPVGGYTNSFLLGVILSENLPIYLADYRKQEDTYDIYRISANATEIIQ